MIRVSALKFLRLQQLCSNLIWSDYRIADIPRDAAVGEQQRVRRERLPLLERAQPLAVHLRRVQVGRRAGQTGCTGKSN